MVGIIEHGNTGANAAGAAFGAGLGGFAQGMAEGEKLRIAGDQAKARMNWMQSRVQSEKLERDLTQQAWDLSEQQRQARIEIDALDIPPIVPGNTPTGYRSNVPGVEVQSTFWTPERIELHNSSDQEGRKAMHAMALDEEMLLGFQAEVERFETWVNDMETGGPGYEESNATQNAKAAEFINEARAHLELFKNDQIPAESMQATLSNISQYLSQAEASFKERLYTSQALGGLIDQEFQKNKTAGLGGDSARLDYLISLKDDVNEGRMPGHIAIGFSGMGPQQAKDMVDWVRSGGGGTPFQDATLTSRGRLRTTLPDGSNPPGTPDRTGPVGPDPELEDEGPTRASMMDAPAREATPFVMIPKQKQKALVKGVAELRNKRDLVLQGFQQKKYAGTPAAIAEARTGDEAKMQQELDSIDAAIDKLLSDAGIARDSSGMPDDDQLLDALEKAAARMSGSRQKTTTFSDTFMEDFGPGM